MMNAMTKRIWRCALRQTGDRKVDLFDIIYIYILLGRNFIDELNAAHMIDCSPSFSSFFEQF